MTQLEQVTEKIWKIIPEKDYNIDGWDVLRLEDVLIALNNIEYAYWIGLDGEFWKYDKDDLTPSGIYWELGKPLHMQEEETILFLNEIL